MRQQVDRADLAGAHRRNRGNRFGRPSVQIARMACTNAICRTHLPANGRTGGGIVRLSDGSDCVWQPSGIGAKKQASTRRNPTGDACFMTLGLDMHRPERTDFLKAVFRLS